MNEQSVTDLVVKLQRDGYAVLKGFINKSCVESLTGFCDALWMDNYNPAKQFSKVEVSGTIVSSNDTVRAVACDEGLINVVTALLGGNICVNYVGVTMNPPQNIDKHPMQFHQDGGRICTEHDADLSPRYSIKVAVWLTHGRELGRGNFFVVPGSHLWKCRPKDNLDDLAIPIFVEAGDAIIFERRVWHTRKQNFSCDMRKVLFVDYAYRWMELKCNMRHTEEEISNFSELEKQLFNNHGYWDSFAPRKGGLPILDKLRDYK